MCISHWCFYGISNDIILPFNDEMFFMVLLLPKIHKKNIPGRPICSSISHPTSNISKFVDEHIKRYVPKTNSYVRDTQHFISRIKQLGCIPENVLLVTLDVSSLYTNIPNQEGLLAVAEHPRSDPDKQKIGPWIKPHSN